MCGVVFYIDYEIDVVGIVFELWIVEILFGGVGEM